MKVIQVYLGNSIKNFNYILYSEKTKEAIFFDPMDLSQTLPRCDELGLVPKYLINTHQHWDHVAANEEFLNIAGTKHLKLADGEEFELSAWEKIKSIFTPGHVMDHFCFLLLENERPTGLICGDAIFNAGIGNCKNGGDVQTSFETMRDIFIHLPEHIEIYPSHDYFKGNLEFAKTIEPENSSIDEYLSRLEEQAKKKNFYISTIAEEKKYNPFFRVFDPDFKTYIEGDEQERFVQIRALRDRW